MELEVQRKRYMEADMAKWEGLAMRCQRVSEGPGRAPPGHRVCSVCGLFFLSPVGP